MKKLWRAFALLFAFTLVAAACGSDGVTDVVSDAADSATDAAGDAADAAGDAAGDAADAAGDAAGDVKDAVTGDDDEGSMEDDDEGSMADDEDHNDGAMMEEGADGIVRFGGLLPETGNLAFLGPPEFAAAELAIQDINAAGGVLGKDAEWLPGDSGDNGEVANQTVDRLLAENVDAFIGAASSGVSLTVIDKITGAGVIHFSPANTSPTFTDYADNGLYFRTAPSDVVQGAALADLMLQDGAETAAFLVLNDSYGTGLLDAAKGPYEDNGGEVVYDVVYDPKADNFDAEIAEVVAADPDAIVVIGFDESAKILTGMIENNIGPSDKMVYGTDGNMGNALATNMGDPTLVAGMRGTLPGVDVAGTLADFRADLDAVDPNLEDYSYSAETYDTMVLVALGAEAAGTDSPTKIAEQLVGLTKDGEKCTTYADCKKLIADGVDIDYDGLSGPLEFGPAGEPTEASILILEFDAEGTLEVVGSVAGKI